MLGDFVGGVGGVEGEVEEEGLLFVFSHKALGFIKPDVGGVAGEFLIGGCSVFVALVGVVELVVAVVIWGLADASAFVPDDVLEADVLWAARGVVAEVPFANHAGGVACFLKVVSHGDLGRFEITPTTRCTEGSGAGGVSPSHERSAGGGTEWTDVEIGEANGVSVEGVEVGGFEDGVTVAGEVAVALVIGDDDDDVWGRGLALRVFGRGGRCRREL